MQNTTKKLYNKESSLANVKTRSTKSRLLDDLKSYSFKDLAVATLWFLFLMVWANWSLSNDQYLFLESIPAFTIITLLLLIKAMDR